PAARLPHGKWDALLDHDLKRRGQKAHDLRVLDPRHLLEPRFGGVGVEGEHQAAGICGKSPSQFRIGDVLLALHGDAPDAETGSDGERFSTALCLAIEAVLSADPESVSRRGGHQEHGNDAESTLAAIECRPAGATPGLAESRQVDAGESSRRHGDTARKQRVGRFPCLASPSIGAYRLHDASSRIQRTNSPNERPLCAASSGTSDVDVMPGWVLTSRQIISPSPPPRSSKRKSERLTPRQPSAR